MGRGGVQKAMSYEAAGGMTGCAVFLGRLDS
jgi:hypothetical protein